LAGRYLYGDLSHAAMRVYDPASRTDADAGLSVDGLTTLGEDPCGRLYTAAYGGTVSRIVDGAPSPCSFPTTPPPSTPTTSPPADTTAPRVSIHVRGLRRVVARRALLLRIRCDERCRLTARGRVPGVARFRETHRTLAAGKRTTVRLRLSRPAARKLRRAINRRGSVRARLQVRATDTAGNERTRARRVRIRHQV
jgi:hypothetical protein